MILILGAKGFIGSALVCLPNTVGCTEDIRDKEKLRPYFKEAEFVVHCAAITPKKIEKPGRDYYGVNVLGTKNVVELCIENNCKLIYLSTRSIHGVYGRTKQEAQKIVEDCVSKGLKVIILRLCPILPDGDPKIKNRRYSITNLVENISNIIKRHNFSKFKLIDYQYEKPVDLYKS